MEVVKKTNRIWKAPNGKLRAIWKIGLLVAVIGVVANPLVLLLDTTNVPVIESSLRNTCVAISVLIAVALLAKFDDTGWTTFGLNWSCKSILQFVSGILIGGTLMLLIVFAGWVSGHYSFEFLPSTVFECGVLLALSGQLLRYFAGSFFEETVSRGILFDVVHQAFPNRKNETRNVFALLTSSLIFGGLHFANPDANTLGVFNLVLAGVLFGLLYLKSGDLWLPIGAHMAWNVVQNNLFGLANSGQESKASLFISKVEGSSQLTGGGFGPEAGWIATIVLTIAILTIGPRAIRRSQVDQCRSPEKVLATNRTNRHE